MAYKLYDAEIAYLESDGNAYIDTDIVLTSAHIIDIDFTHKASQRLIGTRSSTIASIGFYGSTVDLYANATTITNGRLTSTFTVGTRYKVHVENGKRQIKDSNNVVLAQNTFWAESFNTGYKTPIFALRWNNSSPSADVGCIHSISITYQGNKILDMIPVRKGTTGYLFDKVSGKLFGNAGTGSFTLGQDVGEGAEAEEVAFLQGTGTQYINTGYYPNNKTVLHAKYRCTTTGDTPLFVRWTGASTYDTFGAYVRYTTQSIIYYGRYSNSKLAFIDHDVSEDVELTIGLTSITLNGETTPITREAFTSTYPLWLFYGNNMGELLGVSHARIYSCTISEDGVTLLDLIPVQYNGIGYMYDKVSGQLFGNKGTGKFIIGYIKGRSYTRRELFMEIGKPYDAEVEYIASTTSSGFEIVTNNGIPARSTFELKYQITNVLDIYTYQVFFSRYSNVTRTPTTRMGSRSQGYYYQGYDNNGNARYLLRTSSRNTNLHTIKVDYTNKKITLDGTESNFDFASFNPSTDSPRICLFKGIDSNYQGLVGRIYSFKATYNNQVVLDLVPVRKGNVGMMYDKITGYVYKNNSTGTFTIGPDKT